MGVSKGHRSALWSVGSFPASSLSQSGCWFCEARLHSEPVGAPGSGGG